ncbi:AAA family ATPase [Oceanobacillus jeddahense]|uniref:AAA family ATPase n=1 Tax=Oceanobacillus jeddahense TaxID=1462527 RepID=A0ABY5JS20_9BACI|nr:AAA family ATPase [Oceanobacillus jeddahense]UUI03096.1 AAA family ATPase [Oceanobacillus jeddahense]
MEADGQHDLKVISFDENVNKIVEAEEKRTTLHDIIGLEDVKNRIQTEFITPIQSPEILEAFDKKLGGLLFYGPPGFDEKSLAQAIAGEIHANFIYLNLQSLLSKQNTEREQIIQQVFAAASKQASSVLFIDNLDFSEEMQQVFLHELDRFVSNNEAVHLLGATHAPWDLNPELRQAGRFDSLIYLPLPDNKAREQILSAQLENKPVADNLELDLIADYTEDFSEADLIHLIQEAIDSAITHSLKTGTIQPLDNHDLLYALDYHEPITLEWLEAAGDYAAHHDTSHEFQEVLADVEGVMPYPRSLKEKYALMFNLLKKNDAKTALYTIEDIIREEQEKGENYVLLSHCHFITGNLDAAKKWMESALKVDFDNPFVFQSALRFYQDSQADLLRWGELAKIGFEKYPEDAFYHYQYGLAFLNEDGAGLEHVKEAARMDPENAKYPETIAAFSIFFRNWKDYKKYEQLALEADPENTVHLTTFAKNAYDQGKYNKSLHLIKEAMRLEPDSKFVRYHYSSIYPVSNRFVRLKRATNRLLSKYFQLPLRLFPKKQTAKHPYLTYAISILMMFAILFAGFYALTGKGAFYLFGGFIIWSIISGRVGKKNLQKAGFSDSEQGGLDTQTDFRLRKIQTQINKDLEAFSDYLVETASSTTIDYEAFHSLEENLANIWESDSEKIEEIKTKAPESLHVQRDQTEKTKDQKKTDFLSYPKEGKANYAALFLSIAVSLVAMFIQYYPQFSGQGAPQPVDEDLKEHLQNTSQERADSLTENIEGLQESAEAANLEESEEHVNQFLSLLDDGAINIEDIQTLTTANIAEHLEANAEADYVSQLANASVSAIASPSDTSESEIYVTNEATDFEAVIGLEDSRIQSIYVEGWDDSEDYQEELQEKLNMFH